MTERTIEFPDDLKPKWIDRFVADVKAHVRGAQSGNETYPAPHHGWICFHCGERFTTKEGAAIHFGTVNDDRPSCVERYRTALENIAGFGSVPLNAEWECGLRDIIRSMIDCAKTALTAGERGGA